MSKVPKLIVPRMVLTLAAKDSSALPSDNVAVMPDLVATLDREALRDQALQQSQVERGWDGGSEAGKEGSRGSESASDVRVTNRRSLIGPLTNRLSKTGAGTSQLCKTDTEANRGECILSGVPTSEMSVSVVTSNQKDSSTSNVARKGMATISSLKGEKDTPSLIMPRKLENMHRNKFLLKNKFKEPSSKNNEMNISNNLDKLEEAKPASKSIKTSKALGFLFGRKQKTAKLSATFRSEPQLDSSTNVQACDPTKSEESSKESPDSGNSSCNGSDIINVQASDFAKLDPNLRVRCQSLDILTVSDDAEICLTTTDRKPNNNISEQGLNPETVADVSKKDEVPDLSRRDKVTDVSKKDKDMNETSAVLNDTGICKPHYFNEKHEDSQSQCTQSNQCDLQWPRADYYDINNVPLHNTTYPSSESYYDVDSNGYSMSSREQTLKGILKKNSNYTAASNSINPTGQYETHSDIIMFSYDNELPYGWEKVEDPHYGTYFIDHVNRKTQYENPVLQAKRQAQEGRNVDIRTSGANSSKKNHANGNLPAYPQQRPVFTKNPAELRGEHLKTQLEKGPKGFGFTIIGANEEDEEFLQINHIVPNGIAAHDGKLRTGDILVYVNEKSVLGCTHKDVVSIFQTIAVGEKVTLEVCRGYPLPFDPDDPNTEIVTRMAVTLPQDSRTQHAPPEYSRAAAGSNGTGNATGMRSNNHVTGSANRVELITVYIEKGAMGFGFTIADSAYGQRVRQILDRDRCQRLSEGDILVEINNHKVKDMRHADVVTILKECPLQETARIVVQRGGIPTVGSVAKKQSEESSVPNSQYYGQGSYVDDGEGGSLLDEGIDTRFYAPSFGSRHNESYDSWILGSRDYNAPDLVNSSQQRPPNAAANGDFDRQSARSPADLLGQEVDSYTRQGARQQNDYIPYGSQPNGGVANRNDLSSRSFGQYDRSDGGGGGGGTSRYRSRTPGPEFMRSREREDEQLMGAARGREVARSKTPTSELLRQQSSISGTPDFIPASRYQSPPRTSSTSSYPSAVAQPALTHYSNSQQQNHPYISAPQQQYPSVPPQQGYTDRPFSATDFTQQQQPHNSGSGYDHGRTLSTSQSHNSALSRFTQQSNIPPPSSAAPQPSLAPYGTDAIRGSTRKQSTSFEYVDPRPSNLTRIPPYLDRIDSHGSDRGAMLDGGRSGQEEERVMELTVYLQRQANGFGFRIIGGTEEGSQVAVGHIVPGGAADLDGRLRAHDEIVMVDREVVLGSSHRHVVALIGQSGKKGQVTLAVRRRAASDPGSQAVNGPHSGVGPLAVTYPYDVTVTRRENEGFGFVIISSVARIGSVIGRILEGSPAVRCGRLRVGDRIMKVNGNDIKSMHHEDIVTLIKDSGYSVTLTVGPPQDEGYSSNSQSSQRTDQSNQGSMINAMAYPAHSESDISRRSDYSPHGGPGTPPHPQDRVPQQHILDRHRELARQRALSSSQASPAMSADSDGSGGGGGGGQMFRLELHRGSRGFGFSIRGGREFNNMALYVLKIAPGGAAALDQRMKVGDEIVEINGRRTTNMTHAEAIDLIQAHGSTVSLVLRRTGTLPPQIAPQNSGSHMMSSQLPVRSTTKMAPTVSIPNGPSSHQQGPLSQSSPNPNRQPPGSNYFQANFPRY